MRKIFGILATAGLMMIGSNMASAQGFDVRIGVGEPGPRVVRERYERPAYRERYERPAYRERVIERRVERPRRVRTVCRMVMRERVRPNGVVVRRPVEVCRQVVAGRRW